MVLDTLLKDRTTGKNIILASHVYEGFDMEFSITKHNFKHLDALPYAKEGTLQEKLDEVYGK